MKKITVWILLLFLALGAAAAAAEDGDLDITEIVGEVDLDAATYGDTTWRFPVALEDMRPEYVILANKHYLLDEKFTCEPLTVIKNMSLRFQKAYEEKTRLNEELEMLAMLET